MEELAFAEDLKKVAPNPNLLWLRGNYVEADVANRNRQLWTANELAIKHLTPMFCPVTVMHDFETAVGVIADVSLKTPEKSDVPRSRIDTSLAVWAHRFPEIAEECKFNYENGTLMQSMEAFCPNYSCSECGQMYQRLAGGAEEEQWCACLRGDTEIVGARTLQGTFTGTGLIFGSRGAQGANPAAYLEADFQAEVAEFHTRAHSGKAKKTSTRRSRRNTPMDEIEISKSEYAELQKRPSVAELQAAEQRAKDAEAEKAKAEKDLEAAEAAQKQAEDAKAKAEKELEEAQEAERAEKLKSERMESLGKGFVAKLGEKTKERLSEQAKSMSDEDWKDRLDELSEAYGVKPDAAGEAGEGEAEFSSEEVSGSALGEETSSADKGLSPEARRSIFKGIVANRPKN